MRAKNEARVGTGIGPRRREPPIRALSLSQRSAAHPLLDEPAEADLATSDLNFWQRPTMRKLVHRMSCKARRGHEVAQVSR